MRTIETNGVALGVDDRGDGYPVVLVHGFPELAHSWRHQVPALVDAGFRAISFDLRGTGASSGPQAVEEYALTRQVGDVVGVLDRLGLEQAVVVGHDWGSIIAYATALSHPARVSHVVSLNVPYLGLVSGFPPTEVIATKLRDRFGYVLSFIDPAASEAAFDRDPAGWLSKLYARVAGREGFLTPADLNAYVDGFAASGLTGQFNLYRNIDRNLEDFKHLDRSPLTQPTLMVTVDLDPILPPSTAGPMGDLAPDLTVRHIADCGHWTQQEQPDALNSILIDWLDERVA